MKKITAIVAFVTMSVAAFAQSHSVGDLAFSLYSIQNLSGGVHVTDMDTPHNTMFNPASAAVFQRTTVDLNYINLQGLGAYSGVGHVANAAISIPTKYGVFTSSLRWIGTELFVNSDMDFGNIFIGNFTFSKEIYSDLYLGLGINLSGGAGVQNNASFDWGAGLNLGFLHMPGDISFMKNFKWGISLINMGKGFGDGTKGYFNAIPSNFTLATGVRFDLISSPNFVWTFETDVRTPLFSDLKIDIGTDILIAKLVNIDSSVSLSIRDAIGGEIGTLIPSVGVSVKIPLSGNNKENIMDTSEINANIAAAPLYNGLWAFGGGVTMPFGSLDENPPNLKVEFEKTQYISPNFDGTQDELIIPFTVDDERYIKGYQLIIKNEEGAIVKEIFNKDERPENESLKNLFTLIVSEKVGASIPQSFRWDGKADSGEMVSDGKYNFTIVFWDDNKNYTEPYSGVFIIDTISPEIIVEPLDGTNLIFSPDGDGNKDSIQFTQSGSVESEWKATISDASGSIVKDFVWYGTIDNAIWDGTDNDGNLVPDGVYEYKVIAIDEAGNTIKKEVANDTFWDDLDLNIPLSVNQEYEFESIEITDSVEALKDNVISNIIVNTKKPPVSLYIDKAWFAPGSENGEQELFFTLDVPVKTGIVEWELKILDMNRESVKIYSSKEEGWGPVPKKIDYEGLDQFNSQLKEGKYQGILTVTYQNGYVPIAESPHFNVDITNPESSVKASYAAFSPNGDSNKDEAVYTQSASVEELWTGNIEDTNGNIVKSFSWKDGITDRLVWDGRDSNGEIAPNGEYVYYLSATDKAGNSSLSNKVVVQLDNSDTVAAISVNLDAFSPNDDNVKDSIILSPIIKEGSRVKSYEIDLLFNKNKKIRSWIGDGDVPKEIVWQGTLVDGSLAEEGEYKSHIKIVYEKGDIREADSSSFELDMRAPEINLSSEYTVFSPDGDGLKDVINFEQESTQEDEFIGELFNSKGESIRSWFWTNKLTSLSWDGNDESGNKLIDGTYSYVVSSEDKGGNRTEKSINDIKLDTSDTPLFLTVKHSAFSPSLNNGINSQELSVIVSNREGIESWELNLVHSDGSSSKNYNGTGSDEIPKKILWDGKGSNEVIKEGSYIAKLSIVYEKGNNPQIESTSFVLDNSAPKIGLYLQPNPFSPDDDNVDDELKISISVDDLSPLKNWEMIINDPKGREFISFKGRGRPSERIIWDGRSMKGELVQSAEDYRYSFKVSDILGNSQSEEGVIPVDVLVVRDGDRFKIQISSITFKADSAEYNETGDLKEKNEKILKRISEILKKYSSYKIVIEGNAASTKYYDQKLASKEEVEELQPLSLQRAETVRNSLVSFGILKNRLDVVGQGGTNPVVPHSDLENAWKNRRVEFILIK